LVPRIKNVKVLTVPDGLLSWVYRTDNKSILQGFKKGHLGTARLWSNLFRSRSEEVLLHLDADTVFLGNVLEGVHAAIEADFDVVGTRRPYQRRTYRLDGDDAKALNRLPDVVNTDLMAVRRSSIPNLFSPLLTRRIRGKRGIRHPIIDFFDPITFEIIRNGGQVYYLDSPNQGNHSVTNFESSFFEKRLVFSAVGSGFNFTVNPEVATSPSYKEFAIASYSLYSKYLLDTETGHPTLADEKLVRKLERLDRTNWILK